MPTFRKCLVPLVAGVMLAACSDIDTQETIRTTHPQSRPRYRRPPREVPVDVRGALLGVSGVLAALFPPTTTTTNTAPSVPSPPVVSVSMNVADVMACIRAHESGDYTNHTNGPEGASGAYQYMGATWRHWSIAAGFPGTSAAYLAAPATQDAVTVYTLTHGGAGNWSPRYGPDPCTVGWGG